MSCSLRMSCALLLTLVTLLAGCAPGRIERIVVENLGGPRPAATLSLIREGTSSMVAAPVELKQGDVVETPAGVSTIIWLQGGSRLLVAPSTRIQLVNPNHIIRLLNSFGEAIGTIFVSAKDALRIDGEYVAATTHGTEYQVSRGPDDRFTVSVVSGRVLISSTVGAFSPVMVGRMESAAVVRGSSSSVVVSRLARSAKSPPVAGRCRRCLRSSPHRGSWWSRERRWPSPSRRRRCWCPAVASCLLSRPPRCSGKARSTGAGSPTVRRIGLRPGWSSPSSHRREPGSGGEQRSISPSPVRPGRCCRHRNRHRLRGWWNSRRLRPLWS